MLFCVFRLRSANDVIFVLSLAVGVYKFQLSHVSDVVIAFFGSFPVILIFSLAETIYIF